jgi:hypothetical protein
MIEAGLLPSAHSAAFLPEQSPLRRRPRAPARHRPEAFEREFEDRALVYDAFWHVDGRRILLVGPPPLNLRPALALSDLMPVSRDFAFVLDRDVPAANVLRAARNADKALIVGVDVFDLFEGGALGEGKKSMAITVTLQPRERTLTDEEIDGVSAAIVAAVAKATGGVLRS